GPDLANFIIAYRLYGGTQSSGPSQRGATRLSGNNASAVTSQVNSDRANRSNRRLTNISSLFDLVSATVSVPVGTGRNQRTINYPSHLQDTSQQQQLLPSLLDVATTSLKAEVPARINVNTASQAVLSTLPGLNSADVQAILTNRPQLSTTTTADPIYQTPA